jgi:carbonic anhydrase/acetyltransferase-like protein (isoleucine patch superfamily)
MIRTFGGKEPSFDGSVYIAENASVIGDVSIGTDSSVWFGAVLRGDLTPIRIGCRTSIQDNTVIHVARSDRTAMIVGDDVTVGHNVILHACTIGNSCLIGMGSIILDGSVIGEGSIVGAGALVTKGSVFPPRSMILGSPAKAVRTLSDADIEQIVHSSKIYIDLKNEYIASQL